MDFSKIFLRTWLLRPFDFPQIATGFFAPAISGQYSSDQKDGFGTFGGQAGQMGKIVILEGHVGVWVLSSMRSNDIRVGNQWSCNSWRSGETAGTMSWSFLQDHENGVGLVILNFWLLTKWLFPAWILVGQAHESSRIGFPFWPTNRFSQLNPWPGGLLRTKQNDKSAEVQLARWTKVRGRLVRWSVEVGWSIFILSVCLMLGMTIVFLMFSLL